jgi:hypothetical protein
MQRMLVMGMHTATMRMHSTIRTRSTMHPMQCMVGTQQHSGGSQRSPAAVQQQLLPSSGTCNSMSQQHLQEQEQEPAPAVQAFKKQRAAAYQQHPAGCLLQRIATEGQRL